MTPSTAQQSPPSASCAAETTAGEPCRATTLTDRAYCWHHDPDLEERRREARARGGRERSTIRRAIRRLPTDLADVRDRLASVLVDVEEGRLDPGTARAVASVAGVLVRIHEATTLDRIEELEELLAELERERAAARPPVNAWEHHTR